MVVRYHLFMLKIITIITAPEVLSSAGNNICSEGEFYSACWAVVNAYIEVNYRIR